jgi:hypothetical protein
MKSGTLTLYETRDAFPGSAGILSANRRHHSARRRRIKRQRRATRPRFYGALLVGVPPTCRQDAGASGKRAVGATARNLSYIVKQIKNCTKNSLARSWFHHPVYPVILSDLPAGRQEKTTEFTRLTG